MLKCDSFIESWILATFFDWLLFIPGLRPLNNNTKFNNSYMQILSKFGVKYNARKIPETPNKTFIVRSSCIHHSHCAPVCAPFAFWVRSTFSVHISLSNLCSDIIHSAFVQCAFTVGSPFKWGKCNVSGTVTKDKDTNLAYMVHQRVKNDEFLIWVLDFKYLYDQAQ